MANGDWPMTKKVIPMFRKLAALFLAVAMGSAFLAAPSSALALDDAGHEAAAAHDAGGHGSGGGNPNILELKPSLAIATLIVFLVLLAILRAYAWTPLMQALHDREHHLEHTLTETEKARDEAARLLDQHRAELARASDQVRALIDDARAKAVTLKDDLIRSAQEEAEANRQRVEREINAAKDRALLELWNTSADLAVNVAGKVLPRELTPADHRKLVEQAIGDLPAGPVKANGQGARV